MPLKKIGRAIGKILRPALPIAGALLGGWVGGKIGGALGGALGGKVGRIAGGVAGGMLGATGGRLQGSQSIQMAVPPYAQKGAEILEQLLGQSSQYAQTVAGIKQPYLEQARTSFEDLPLQISSLFDRSKGEVSSIYDRAKGETSSLFKTAKSEIPSLFGRAKGEVSGFYDDLLSQTRNIITSEQARQNMRLGALGLLNTQAQQWTMADILDRTAFPILTEKTRTLANLVGTETGTLVDFTKTETDKISNLISTKASTLTDFEKLKANALLNYLFMKPDFYMRFGDEMLSANPSLIEQQRRMDIAKSMMGVPTIAQPVYKKGLLDYLPAFGQMATAYWLLRR